ncbi:hypothetical protein [Streptomyces sp. x-80]|uniref:hypothetical protein n=1 Tax=Streptomyces sp. x-80 TaxID=2789282 RepID=UPI00397FC8DE
MDSDAQHLELKRVRIVTEGARAFLEIDGVDYSTVVAGYTMHHQAGQVPELVVQYTSASVVPEFDGYARVAVGVPYEPGPAAAHFLSAMDPGLLEKAALARSDMSGGPHGYTAAVLAQLQQWACGELESSPEN